MSPRSHPSVVKRRKELARRERQQEKARRKLQRKQEKLVPHPDMAADAPVGTVATDPVERTEHASGNER